MLEENIYSKYLDKDHFLASGKKITAYRYQDLVIKVFHETRMSPIERISDEGLVLLSTLNFLASLDMLKEDVRILSENGFCIDDLYYNAMCNHGRLLFTDMTSYHYIKTNVPFLKDQFYKKNIEKVNIFLIGYL